VRDGLPEWLEGKIDTARLSTANGETAVLDGGGNLWWSSEGARGWSCLARDVEHACSVLIV
jgi:hypothetical protein